MKAWSEQELSDENDNVQVDIQSKKRRKAANCSKSLEKEFLKSNNIKHPKNPINSSSNLLLIFIIKNMFVKCIYLFIFGLNSGFKWYEKNLLDKGQ